MQGSRRRFLLSATALSACGPKLAKRFNGYAFVASQAMRGISVVNLTRFHMEKEIALDDAPILVLNVPNTRRVLALTPASVTEIDAGPMAITHHAKVGTHARTMALSPDGDYIVDSGAGPASSSFPGFENMARQRPGEAACGSCRI